MRVQGETFACARIHVNHRERGKESIRVETRAAAALYAFILHICKCTQLYWSFHRKIWFFPFFPPVLFLWFPFPLLPHQPRNKRRKTPGRPLRCVFEAAPNACGFSIQPEQSWWSNFLRLTVDNDREVQRCSFIVTMTFCKLIDSNILGTFVSWMALCNPTNHISVLPYSTNKNFTSKCVNKFILCFGYCNSFSLFKKETREIVTLVHILALEVMFNYRRTASTYIISPSISNWVD